MAITNGSPARTADGGVNGTSSSSAVTEFLPNGATIGGDGISDATFGSYTLPIELVSFTAVHRNHRIELKWVTASEVNNDFFTIERTVNGASFEKIATVKGAGNSNTEKSYSAVDESPVYGTAYYRLKQTDFDGKYEYSELVSVTVSVATVSECTFRVFPNPCPGQCSVVLSGCEDQSISVAMIDALGNVVYSPITLTPEEKSFTIDARNNLKPGVYFLTASAEGKVKSERVVIANRSYMLLLAAFGVFINLVVTWLLRKKIS